MHELNTFHQIDDELGMQQEQQISILAYYKMKALLANWKKAKNFVSKVVCSRYWKVLQMESK